MREVICVPIYHILWPNHWLRFISTFHGWRERKVVVGYLYFEVER